MNLTCAYETEKWPLTATMEKFSGKDPVDQIQFLKSVYVYKIILMLNSTLSTNKYAWYVAQQMVTHEITPQAPNSIAFGRNIILLNSQKE